MAHTDRSCRAGRAAILTAALLAAAAVAPAAAAETGPWTLATDETELRVAIILCDCKVHHVLPRPDGKRWDGLFYWGPKIKKGIFFIFRPQSDEARQTVKLKGLEAGTRYAVWSEDGSIQPGEMTGRKLMETGLDIHLPSPLGSDLILIQDAALPKPK
jgi:hypothetical protein